MATFFFDRSTNIVPIVFELPQGHMMVSQTRRCWYLPTWEWVWKMIIWSPIDQYSNNLNVPWLMTIVVPLRVARHPHCIL